MSLCVANPLVSLSFSDEFLEPVTPSFLEKLVVKARKMDTTFMEGQVKPGAVPPPSDYFLGFRSPGTQVSYSVPPFFSLTRSFVSH